jgi:hypothetical protein
MAQIGTVAQFVGHRRLRAVTRKDTGLSRQLTGNTLEALLHISPGTFGEIGTTDAHTEEGVASEGHILFFAIEKAGAVTVARGAEHVQRVGAERDGIAIAKQTANLWALLRYVHAKEVAGLLVNMFNHILVFSTNLHLQAISMEQADNAEIMVKMAVGGQEVDGFQLMVGQIALNGLVLLFVVGTAVNNDTLAGLIAHYVAVLL